MFSMCLLSRRWQSSIRVRYAPSPTGELHLGGLRTALYNYMLAKRNGGTFILRIEDTDQSRQVSGAAERFEKMLNWAGCPPDEGPTTGGQYGPYIQSQRRHIYKHYAHQLLQSNHAYRCFCSAETLNSMRKPSSRRRIIEKEEEEEEEEGKHVQKSSVVKNFYDRRCADLTDAQVNQFLDEQKPHVVRLRVPRQGSTTVHDEVRGRAVYFDNALIDDQVLLKSDGMPTYHLASVVDDHLMCVSHVIRGDEWLISTPKHVLLYEAFGWQPPAFVHLPLLLNAADRTKLSKRQSGTSVEYYRDRGYRADAIVNFVALLGWTPPGSSADGDGGTDVATLEQLTDAFDLSRVHCSPAVVDVAKLDYFNRTHMIGEFERQPERVVDDAIALLSERFGAERVGNDRALVERLLAIVFERPHVHKLTDIVEHVDYVFERPPVASIAAEASGGEQFASLPGGASMLASLSRQLIEEPLVDGASMLARVRAIAKQRKVDGVRPAHLFALARLAVAGRNHGPPFADLIDLIGIDESRQRIALFEQHL